MPLPLLPLAGMALGSIGSLGQILQARMQRRLANSIETTRPTYDIPAARYEALAMVRQGANGTLPGLGMATNNLLASTANASRAAQLAGGSNNALATIAAAQANEQEGLNNLAMNNANYQAGQRQQLLGQLDYMAQEQRNKWQYDKADKYTEDASAKAALTGAAMQNTHAGINGLANVAMVGLNGLQEQKNMQNQNLQNNLTNYHRSQLDTMRNTPLFGGLQSRYSL